MKHIKTFQQLNESSSTERFDVAQTLITMLDGDDVDFEPLDPDDSMWAQIGLPTFALDPPDDIEEFVNEMPEEEFNNLKHALKTEGFLNEGFFSWLFKKIYKVNYTAELTDNKTGEPISYKSYLTVKAKNEEEAEDKFYDKWNESIKKLDSKPKVIVGNIKKTVSADKTSIEFPRAINKDKERDTHVKVKKKEEPKKEEKKKEEKKK